MINSNQYQNLEKLIQMNEISTWHSKAMAQKYALKRHWNKKDVVLVERDLDKQWIIAKQKDDYIECLLAFDIGSVKLKEIE